MPCTKFEVLKEYLNREIEEICKRFSNNAFGIRNAGWNLIFQFFKLVCAYRLNMKVSVEAEFW